MPQMSPYNWLILFLLFTFMMLYLISMIYFIYTPTLIQSKKNYKYLYNWKW